MAALLLLSTVALLCAGAAAHSRLSELPSLPVNQTRIDVSGLSAGGFMAVQFHLAFSSIVGSAGVIAGGPYYCARDSKFNLEQCMSLPELLNTAPLIAKALDFSNSGQIDMISNLTDDNVWLYSGRVDTLVTQGVMKKLLEFYQHFVTAGSITTDFEQISEHGFPTLDYGNNCKTLESPYILKCDYDAAAKVLVNAYGALKPAVAADPSNVIMFDQSSYGVNNNMAANGYLYVPTACNGSSRVVCKLHVAFHGCEQSYEFINTDYVEHTGYLGYAEANNIVVLFPQSGKNPIKGNPKGCFDWWGYTNSDYAVKAGPQMNAVKLMIDKIMGKGI